MPPAGGRETVCVRCEQVDDLIRMVAELKEEVERLRAIRECEREMDWWSNSLCSLKGRHQGETPQMGVDPLPCCHRAEGKDLGVEEEWKQVPAQHRRRCPPLPAPPSQVEDSFLTQLVSEPTRGGAPLDLLFTNREGLVGDVVVGNCLGQSDHEMMEFSILGEARKGTSKTTVLDFWRADFELLRTLVGRVPWEVVLKGRGVQEGWALFKKEILMAQERSVPTCPKMSRHGRRLAWLNRKLPLELRRKKRVYNLWKKGRATQEDYKDVARLCRDKIRNA